MIPETLAGWTLAAIEALLVQGVFESDRFDFKEKLPHKADDKDKLRLTKACAAFANSDGGFLVFGVKDEKGLAPSQRLVGLDRAVDFPEKFGNFPATAVPGVEWAFKNPPIETAGGNVLHVVHVPSSARKPHAVFEDGRWWFCKRTNKGTESMSYEEVRLAFQDTEMRRTKLALLVSEIDATAAMAKRVVAAFAEGNPSPLDAFVTKYPSFVIDSILGDAFALLASDKVSWRALQRLRDAMHRSNALTELLLNALYVPISGIEEQRTMLLGHLHENAKVIAAQAITAGDRIAAVLGDGSKKP